MSSVLFVSALSFQRAMRYTTKRRNDTYTNRLLYASGGSAHRGIINSQHNVLFVRLRFNCSKTVVTVKELVLGAL